MQRKWEFTMKESPPEILFVTTRHPLTRLVSGWNNILCNRNCRDNDRVKYASTARNVSFVLWSIDTAIDYTV